MTGARCPVGRGWLRRGTAVVESWCRDGQRISHGAAWLRCLRERSGGQFFWRRVDRGAAALRRKPLFSQPHPYADKESGSISSAANDGAEQVP